MKTLLLLFIFIGLSTAKAQKANSAYDELVHVNGEWRHQSDLKPELKRVSADLFSEKERIQFHLRETENLLRRRNISHLSAAQQEQRSKNLNTLHRYMKTGIFPINNQHQNRQPYFIDDNNIFCAVGYLMQQSGAEAIAQEIKRTQNFNYLIDIQHPDLMNWVASSGLSLDELVLIQPGYSNGSIPPVLLEMHYNNAGVDVNEYIELLQGNYSVTFNELLFYNELNVLYKTLPLSQMQAGSAGLYYYQFPANESFADAGRIELRQGTVMPYTVGTITYNDNSVAVNMQWFPNFIWSSSIGETEATAANSSLTFCGLYDSPSWSMQVATATPGLKQACAIFPTVVPVRLLAFDYSIEDKKVNLFWKTESEQNSSHFIVEKSTDGRNYLAIGRVNAAGTGTSSKSYSLQDNSPGYINQYRLKQVDVDGRFEYSKVLFVKVDVANLISIVENPVQNILKVRIHSENNLVKRILLYDFNGRVIKAFKANAGLQSFDVAELASGKYLLQLLDADGTMHSTSFIKF